MSSGRSLLSQRSWHVFDAKAESVGRIAAKAAPLLMGKHKPTYSPHLDNGDHVVILRAKDAKFSGRKVDEKLYRWHTGWPGGLKATTPSKLMERGLEHRIFVSAVRGMLPKNKLRDFRMHRLHIFPEQDITDEYISSRIDVLPDFKAADETVFVTKGMRSLKRKLARDERIAARDPFAAGVPELEALLAAGVPEDLAQSMIRFAKQRRGEM